MLKRTVVGTAFMCILLDVKENKNVKILFANEYMYKRLGMYIVQLQHMMAYFTLTLFCVETRYVFINSFTCFVWTAYLIIIFLCIYYSNIGII